MSKYIATVIDTTGIQPYIFGSNRLRENIGASYLVERATNEWVKSALRQKFGDNLYIPHSQPATQIDRDNLDAELVYTGGGNAVILFKDRDCAVAFTKILSEKVLKEAPGLKIVVAHSEPFEWGHSLGTVVDRLMKELERKKREYNPSVPLLGLGVTASCLSTGLVAVDTSDRYSVPTSYPVSREIVEKLRAVDSKNDAPANKKLIKTLFEDLEIGDCTVPYDVDDLGRTEGRSSYMAIVHADGNGMGDRFKEYGKNKRDRDYITAMRELSAAIDKAGINALRKVADRVIQLAEGKLQEQFAITKRDGRKYLPFRPIVYGGDDVTFVCDGRLGLSLAALYLKAFEAEKENIPDGKDLTACAGIAIVKTHYPFATAYQLSEALCSNAKKFMRDEKERLIRKSDFSAIDWHIAASGLLGSIGDIRKREYQVAEGNLTMRPMYLQSDREWRNWDDFSEVVHKFNTDTDWSGSRNKVIALREQLRQGTEKTKQFLQVYGLDKNYLPPFPKIKTSNDDFYQCGWIDDPRTNQRICGYFDAIEAMEFYMSLKENING